MALRLITSIGDIKKIGARIYKDTEWNEYRTKFYKNGKTRAMADSFTHDKDDAIHTAEFEVRRQTEKYKKPAAKKTIAKKSTSSHSAVEILKKLERNKNPIDKDGARKLELFIDNDGQLYNGQRKSIITNLARKMAKGVYDKTKAVILWNYLVESAAKKYNKEHGDGTLSLKLFDKETRNEIAKNLEKNCFAAVQDEAIDYAPKSRKNNPVSKVTELMYELMNQGLTVVKIKNDKILASFSDKNEAIKYAKLNASKLNKQLEIHTHNGK